MGIFSLGGLTPKFLSSPQNAWISRNPFCARGIYFRKSCYIYPLQLEIIEIESKKRSAAHVAAFFVASTFRVFSVTSPGMSIRHAKARGEWAELRFMTRATELGFRIANLMLVILREHVFCANEGSERAARTRRVFCDALIARLARILVGCCHRASRTLPPGPSEVHHLPPRQLLQMSPRLQRSPLLAPRPRLHCRASHPHRHLVHPSPSAPPTASPISS